MPPSKCKYRAATLNEVAANVSDGKQGNKPPDSAKRVPHKCETVSPKLRNWFPKTANNRPSHKRQPERSMPIGNCSRPGDANWTGCRDHVVLQAGIALGRTARSGRTERGARGCHRISPANDEPGDRDADADPVPPDSQHDHRRRIIKHIEERTARSAALPQEFLG